MPRFQALHQNKELEFEFVLAEKLGMTVGELRQRISAAEFLEWSMFLSRRAMMREVSRAR